MLIDLSKKDFYVRKKSKGGRKKGALSGTWHAMDLLRKKDSRQKKEGTKGVAEKEKVSSKL